MATPKKVRSWAFSDDQIALIHVALEGSKAAYIAAARSDCLGTDAKDALRLRLKKVNEIRKRIEEGINEV